MKNSHKLALFLLSLLGVSNSQAAATSSMAQMSAQPMISKADIKALFGQGILRYEPITNALHVDKEDMNYLQGEGMDQAVIKSMREIFGPELKIKVVSPEDMYLSSQDRGL